ncbi:MAG: LysM peptidoglycan-binding domain-containing protein [Acidiferrobacterales bacterium]|nr:LysM peptidoglycan-binding domain-containing protein [Acidiferrobacterales bacterium]
MKSTSLRGVLLALVVLLTFSVSGCQLFRAIFGFSPPAEAEMMTMEEPKEEVMDETEVTVEPLMVSDDIHVVSTGENLWNIAGMSSIYNDPFRWPLIYARNKSIEDADLIFPGQELSIQRDLSRDMIDAAVMHAKNRGAWSIGEVEASDTEYRASTM